MRKRKLLTPQQRLDQKKARKEARRAKSATLLEQAIDIGLKHCGRTRREVIKITIADNAEAHRLGIPPGPPHEPVAEIFADARMSKDAKILAVRWLQHVAWQPKPELPPLELPGG